MSSTSEKLEQLKRKIENIKFGDEGFLDEIVVKGQNALSIIEPGTSVENENKIAETVASAKKMREADPRMITRNKKGILWLELSEGVNGAIKELK